MAEMEYVCSDVGEKVKEARLAPDGSDLHMLNYPASRSQGFRQSHFQKTSALDPGGARSDGWGAAHSPCVAKATSCKRSCIIKQVTPGSQEHQRRKN